MSKKTKHHAATLPLFEKSQEGAIGQTKLSVNTFLNGDAAYATPTETSKADERQTQPGSTMSDALTQAWKEYLEMTAKPRVIIEIRGGIVQDVYADIDFEYMVADHDNDAQQGGVLIEDSYYPTPLKHTPAKIKEYIGKAFGE